MTLTANWLIYLRENRPQFYQQYITEVQAAKTDDDRMEIARTWAGVARSLLTKCLFSRELGVEIV